MAGRIAIDEEPAPDGWDRFVVHFEDGGTLALRDKRRLGRARLEPDLAALGPDAAEIGRDEFRARVGRGTAPLKARLMDQAVVAGVGNLLADEILWRARLDPRRPGRRAEHRRARPRAPRGARRHALGAAPRRRPYRRRHRRAPARRRLPALRHGDGARDGRRPHDLLVSGGAALMIRSGRSGA